MLALSFLIFCLTINSFVDGRTYRSSEATNVRSAAGRVEFLSILSRFSSLKPMSGAKWVIVTTVNPPTRQMLQVCATPGWNVLVVGDLSTPETEWQNVGQCYYLSVADQSALDYNAGNLIPFKRYERKIVGYLFVIEAGGEVVFDTDDDNIQATGEPLVLPFDVDTCALTAKPGSISWNAYAHFGRADLWNRGLPLDYILRGIQYADVPDNMTSVRPLIQQGLVNMDPDLDAIARLTRSFEEVSSVRFKHDVPPVAFPRGTYHPINSQNTVYTRDVLWALLLPTTTLYREDDIFRGYWNQRLLWEIGGNLLIQGVTAYQVRNPHDFLIDLQLETDMYRDGSAMLKSLNDWRCPEHLGLDGCIVEIHEHLHTSGFLRGQKDVEISRAWIRDLNALGYRFPLREGGAPKKMETDIDLARCSSGTNATNLYEVYRHELQSYRTTSGVHLAQASRKELEELFDAVECGQSDTRGCIPSDGRKTKRKPNIT